MGKEGASFVDIVSLYMVWQFAIMCVYLTLSCANDCQTHAIQVIGSDKIWRCSEIQNIVWDSEYSWMHGFGWRVWDLEISLGMKKMSEDKITNICCMNISLIHLETKT